MSATKKYVLTDEDRAQLGPWAERWIANAMSTKAMDDEERAIVVEAVEGLYRAAGLEPPPRRRIIFVPSPFVMRFAGGFAAWIWHCRKNRAATDAATDAATYAATYAATADATDAATDDATYDAWYHCDVRSLVRVAQEFDPRNVPAMLRCVGLAYRMWAGGNQWSAWSAFLSFFRHIARLPLDYSKWQHYETLALHSGPRIMHTKFCIVSDRPEILTVDARNRPHNETGPFCRWRDGTGVYAWHGTRVPRWIIEEPHKIDGKAVLAESNAEIRAVMLQLLGGANAVQQLGAKLVHEDDWAQLYEANIDGERVLWAKVVDATPCGTAADGSPVYKDYWLRVDPDAYGGIKTGLAAVASTWRKRTVDGLVPYFERPEDYARSVIAQS